MSHRVRVLFALGSLAGGGSERQVIGLLKHLDRTQFEPLLYLVYGEGELVSEVPGDVPVLSFWERRTAPRWYFPGRIHRLQVRHLAEVLRRHQVDVIYDRAFHTTLITAPAARRAGVARVSVIVTDPEPDLRLCAGRFRRVKQLLLRRAYRTADRIVTVSDGVRQAAIAFYRLPPELVVTIHNPLDLERVQLLGAGPAPDWEPERFHVVSAGRLHAQKGYRHLLFAMHDLVHRRGLTRLLLHVLGQGPQLAELQGLRTKLDLTGHVRFEGFQPNPLPYFRRAQVYCLPSLYEGLPNALLEAIACGTPVLATDCPSGPREILDDGRLGRLVPPADALALADAISDAVEHHDRWRELAAAARSSVVRRFSLPQALQLTEEVLREAHHKRDSIALPHPGADG